MACAQHFALTLALLALLMSDAEAASRRAATRLPKEQVDFFEQKIRPVLIHNCYECHSGDPAKAKAHFVLDTRDGMRKGGESGIAIVPGNPSHSPLIEALKYESLEMPPKQKLSDEVIENFVRWVEMGAPDPRSGKAANPRNKIDLAAARKYWAFQPPKPAPAPQVRNTSWPRTDIDRFVLAQLEQDGLKPVADADRATLLRRVTFDLTGLPPTPEEILEFLADTSPDALSTVVNRLLASPRFGERWGRHWLDVVRFGESTGKERNIPYRYAWRYRDYVIDSFNSGKPYNRFIVEQLAGDLLPSKDAAEHDRLTIATGFLAIGPKGVNVKENEQFRMDQVDDQIDVTSRALLGMTVACARCHDHKFDPIPTADYYALAGIFHSTRTYSGIAPNTKTASDERLLTLSDKAGQAKVPAAEAKEYQDRQRQISQQHAKLAELKKLQRQGPQPGKRAQGKKKNRMTALAKVPPKELRGDIKELQDRIEELESVPSPYTNLLMGVADAETPGNCQVLNRGELENKGPEVARGVLTVLKTSTAAQIPPRQSGRLQLARWIASPDNPLTARVMVNRVWEHLLGQGIVGSVDNFGALGNEPTHPELLDRLAVRFMEDKWAIKRLIRSIVLSRVYQLGCDHDATNFEKDPDNKLFWRMERRRLDAEEIRDAMLLVSGQLSFERPDGSEVMNLSNKQFFGNRALNLNQASNVRSVYLPILRGFVPESLQIFDMADPSLIVGQRDVTTVPTQALYLMNNPFVLRQAELMAKRVLEPSELKIDDRIALAFRIALGRAPSELEQARVTNFIHDYRRSLDEAGQQQNLQLAAWTSFCQTLFATGQFRYAY